ncbi:hypothetical protein TNCV_4233211 [Trichonephila clavipes]|nr:hypothetical protein TNCV_4233211 [Trichonephila clavipes]
MFSKGEKLKRSKKATGGFAKRSPTCALTTLGAAAVRTKVWQHGGSIVNLHQGGDQGSDLLFVCGKCDTYAGLPFHHYTLNDEDPLWLTSVDCRSFLVTLRSSFLFEALYSFVDFASQ